MTHMYGRTRVQGKATPAEIAVESILQWDLSIVRERLAGKLGWSPRRAAAIEREYKKFVCLAVLEPGSVLGMAGQVDEFWHEHILHTRAYVEFTGATLGRYLHHTPTNAAGEMSLDYARTLALLRKRFGRINHRIWPRLGDGGGRCGGDCSSCDNR